MAIAMADYGVQGVQAAAELLGDLLQRASQIKTSNGVEPALNKPELADLLLQLESRFYSTAKTVDLRKPTHAVFDQTFRDRFNLLLDTTTIYTPAFVQIWNLLDIVSILSDDEQCDGALPFLLVEELLDSQTIAGCRLIFDYLESRRERMTAKHFTQKNLVILRSCNALLRRLSRAEDTAFCGRVFIFMFQSFPLGDRSSVNLRGEYHTENVTSYDPTPPKDASEALQMESEAEKMDVDSENNASKLPMNVASMTNDASTSKGAVSAKSDLQRSADELYPIFWSLQESFNQPKKLFEPANFMGFKAGLEATLSMFRSVQDDVGSRSAKPAEEFVKRGTKRKRSHGDDDLANAFNPKYLTSRDLFELEISDLSFRRNILVQVLIVLDFIMSLSARAKDKLAKSLPDVQNKSVMYADLLLSDDDAKWAQDQRKSIAEYLKRAPDGAFFLRMVETVLSRDKNWVRWKIENCRSISKAAISPAEYLQAKAVAKRSTTSKRIRPTPLGSLDLKFLVETSDRSGLERLKDPSRSGIPSYRTFQEKIADDNENIIMAVNEDEKNAAVDAKASKSWRALRIASTTKFAAFDQIEKSDKIDAIFDDHTVLEEIDESIVFPKDRRSVVISGPSGVGKGTMISMLLAKYPNVFIKKLSHTTREPRSGESDGVHYFFVDEAKYNTMRDNDEFIEMNNYNGNDYGTSRKIVDGIIARGKIPVLEMDYHGISQCKDMNFEARYIFLAPPDLSELEQRLKLRGSDDEAKIKERLKIAKDEVDNAKLPGFHDKVFINDDLNATFAHLEAYIFDTRIMSPTNNLQSPRSDIDDKAVEALEADTEEQIFKPIPALEV